jgi:hypothetical protein
MDISLLPKDAVDRTGNRNRVLQSNVFAMLIVILITVNRHRPVDELVIRERSPSITGRKTRLANLFPTLRAALPFLFIDVISRSNPERTMGATHDLNLAINSCCFDD